jgi:hypothetical protein
MQQVGDEAETLAELVVEAEFSFKLMTQKTERAFALSRLR